MTVLEIATILAARDGHGLPETEADFARYGMPLVGGCQGCGACIAAYNAHPQQNGYWACDECSRNPIANLQEWFAQMNNENLDAT